MLLLIEFVMFYTFMYLGTKCSDCEIRNADFAEIDLIGITVHLPLSVPVELPEGLEVLQFRNQDIWCRKEIDTQKPFHTPSEPTPTLTQLQLVKLKKRGQYGGY